MLRIDIQYERQREAKAGTDPGVFGGERRNSLSLDGQAGAVRMGESYTTSTGIRETQAAGQGAGSPIRGKDDRPESGAVTRLVACYCSGEEVKLKPYKRQKFASRYSRADIGLLAQTDEAHDTLSGPATVKIMEREYTKFHQARYERLKDISVAHLYRLRNTTTYRKQRVNIQLTKPTKVAIGERRKPAPGGKPGYLRVDTVHQGDHDGVKGVYHINAVDEVTQSQVVGAVPAICEALVLPMLEAIFRQFPFVIRGFHSDNGSEYINYAVEALLKTLLVQQTKSRPRRSNDNGLVECKNGAVKRKHMGYGHIAPEHAPGVAKFYWESFNPYLNFHRPCGIPTIQMAANENQNDYIANMQHRSKF